MICTQSAKLLRVASFQPPPLPQVKPVRSLSLIAAMGNPAPWVLDAVATPPLAARATLTAPLDALLTTCESAVLADAALVASPP